MKPSRPVVAALCAAAYVLATVNAFAGSTNVAVAANFTDAAKEIAAKFKASTGHDAVLSFGASGQFYTQIKESAPFQIFLSADDERPKKLVDEGLALPESRFTYAIGKLVLWSKDPNIVKGEETLKANAFNKLSIANPTAAPYGAAAVETLKALKLYDDVQPKIVMGNTISQPSSSWIRVMPSSASSRSRSSQATQADRGGWCHRTSIARFGRTPCC